MHKFFAISYSFFCGFLLEYRLGIVKIAGDRLVFCRRMREVKETGFMISNQILQSTLDGLKAIARVELCVIDVDGKTAATTADGLEEYLPQARAFVDSPADSQEVQGNQF